MKHEDTESTREKQATAGLHPSGGGASPTLTLQTQPVAAPEYIRVADELAGCHARNPVAAPADVEAMTLRVDAAMIEMSNIHPPLRRSECERLIRAALYAAPAQPASEPLPADVEAMAKYLEGTADTDGAHYVRLDRAAIMLRSQAEQIACQDRLLAEWEEKAAAGDAERPTAQPASDVRAFVESLPLAFGTDAADIERRALLSRREAKAFAVQAITQWIKEGR